MWSWRILDKQKAFFLRKVGEKESVGLVPTRNVLLIPQEQDQEEPGELALLSSPCQLPAQGQHKLPKLNAALCGL